MPGARSPPAGVFLVNACVHPPLCTELLHLRHSFSYCHRGLTEFNFKTKNELFSIILSGFLGSCHVPAKNHDLISNMLCPHNLQSQGFSEDLNLTGNIWNTFYASCYLIFPDVHTFVLLRKKRDTFVFLPKTSLIFKLDIILN